MPTINEITTLATNADKEQLPITTAVELKNLRPVNGKLVKTNGFGQLITAVPSDIFNYFFVYVNENLTDGKLYIGVIINSGTNQVIIEGYDANLAQWTQMNTGSDVTFNSMTFNIPAETTWHHANLENPVMQLDDILRLYPGNIADADAKLIWIGFIEREYYDGLFTPADYTAKFFGFTGSLDKPDLTFTVSQLQGGDKGTFTPSDTDIDTRFYRFAYLYDGIQESLLSDQIGVTYDESIDMFGKFQFTIDRTTQSKRITGLKMYRATDDDSAQELIQTIDFLRDEDDTGIITSSTSYTGQNAAYIPGATDTDFDSGAGGPFVLEFGGSNVTLSTSPTGTGNTVFFFTGANADEDLWNSPWKFKDSAGAELTNGSNALGGAYSGINTLIIVSPSSALKLNNYAGGIVEITSTPVTHSDNIISIADNTDDGLIYTTTFDHNLDVGDIVFISEVDTAGNEDYNGKFIVSVVATVRTFEIENVAFNATDVGHFIKQSDTRQIDANVDLAVHSSEAWTINRNNQPTFAEACRLVAPVAGLFYPTLSTDDITYTIYDPNLIGLGEFAPHQEVKFSEVNGKFAVSIQNRLLQYNITLNPNGDETESHPDWLMVSDLDQPDMMPVDNLSTFRIQSQEGGEGTGLAELFGNAVAMKEHSLTTIYLNNRPDDLTQWFLRTSAFNVGNIAPNGFITVGNANLYVVYHNGIYRFRPNDLAEANESSVKDFRISEPINDIFMDMTLAQKQAVHSEFDQEHQEILFTFNTRVFAWNIQFEAWREVSSGGFKQDLEFADVGSPFNVSVPSVGNNILFALDKNGETLIFPFQKTIAGVPNDNVVADFKIRSASVAESVPVSVQSKTFANTSRGAGMSDWRPQVIRYLHVTYKSSSTVDAELYTEKNGLNSSDTPLLTITLPDTSDALVTKRFRMSGRAEKYNIRIADGRNSDAVEIDKILITNQER